MLSSTIFFCLHGSFIFLYSRNHLNVPSLHCLWFLPLDDYHLSLYGTCISIMCHSIHVIGRETRRETLGNSVIDVYYGVLLLGSVCTSYAFFLLSINCLWLILYCFFNLLLKNVMEWCTFAVPPNFMLLVNMVHLWGSWHISNEGFFLQCGSSWYGSSRAVP